MSVFINTQLDTIITFTGTEGQQSYVLSINLLINNAENAWQEFETHLSDPELKSLQQKITPAAKNGFSMGRIAAKKALSHFTNRDFKETSIEPGIFGFPVLVPNPDDLCVSIAHTDKAAIAICYSEKLICGIDIELIDSNKNAIMQSVFTTTELELKRPTTLDDSLFLHLLWAAREALSKSLKTGFLIPILLFEISEIIESAGYFTIYFKNFPFMKGLASINNGYMIVIVIPYKLKLQDVFSLTI
jgi:4'-phosphopantetheinyl transferase EntD